MAIYYCEHCDKKFDASETDIPRCPSCFWTTSVRLLNEAIEQEKESANQTKSTVSQKLPVHFSFHRIFRILIVAVLAFWALWFLKNTFYQPPGVLKNIGFNFSKKEPVSKADEKNKSETPAPISSKVDLSLLSPFELGILSNSAKVAIPRGWSSDESEILNRRADFSFHSNQIQKPGMWASDEFEKFLTKQQKTKGIYFSGGYESKLIRLFKDHYLKADEAFSKNDYQTARLEFLQALVFPVYSNNLLRHRAIVLVMLQPYINDVLGKIRLLNSHVLMQRIGDSIRKIQIKYESLFDLIKEKDIEKAFQLVESLEKDVESINQTARQVQVDYPQVVNQIDDDIKRGLNLQDEALAPVSTGLNSVAADLRIKKKVLSQNLPSSLRSVQQEYEKALSAIREKSWADALLLLEKIQFPPELADDARQKEMIIRKLKESRT